MPEFADGDEGQVKGSARSITGIHIRDILDAIAINVDLDIWPNEAVQKVKLAYRLDVNEYRGNSSLQLMVENSVPD